jgi:hypothetical protein
VIAQAFMPMLAYGQLAHFPSKKLGEKWPEAPRSLVERALALAGVRPAAQADRPVVETALLHAPQGSALVLANYTYEPIARLGVALQGRSPGQAFSCALGKPVAVSPAPDGFKIETALDCADVILLSYHTLHGRDGRTRTTGKTPAPH